MLNFIRLLPLARHEAQPAPMRFQGEKRHHRGKHCRYGKHGLRKADRTVNQPADIRLTPYGKNGDGR